ncbi:DUF4355 domain-containing protein [Cytobacillus horneckiae]|uniref:DUF4355 domain-containing protein n=1 Tax=Cytobacillus horneckiae TaxID=549687 RepID=UPI003D9A5779
MTKPFNVMNDELFKNKVKLPLKLDLQLFSDDNPPGGDGSQGGGDNPPPKKIELTEAELLKKIESESDRKLSSALEKKQQEWESQTEQKIQAALAEKERLSQLSEKERKDEELNNREKEIENRLAELERKELKADAVTDLTEKGLPSSFADFVLGKNAETTLANINAIKTAFDEAVNAAVKERLRQDTPPGGSAGSTTKNPFSKEHFNLTEQGRLLKEDPELYKKLKASAN